jgi:LDH2 family malate/lactate/ureidoglycolate dehydrogenase
VFFGEFHTIQVYLIDYKRFKKTKRKVVALYFRSVEPEILSESVLRNFTRAVFLQMGCSDKHAEEAADVLIHADLRGIDSHGVARLSGYVRLWKAGRVNATPAFHLSTETPSTATLNADGALGLVSALHAMRIAIEKARICGSGWVAVRNSNHFGIAAHHALMAAREGMIGFAVTNASPLVTPAGGAERMLGTNPVCYAFPAGEEAPFVLDMATSAASNGKLEIAERKGKPVPEGWLTDQEGNASTDPSALRSGGMLLTLGSDPEHGDYKGYGLSSVVDLLSGVLSGANYGPWVPPFVSYLPVLPDLPGEGIGHFVGAMRVDGFRPLEEYQQHMDRWIRRFRETKARNSDKPVLIPGEPEAQAAAYRRDNGIPVNDKVMADLRQLANDLNLNFA